MRGNEPDPQRSGGVETPGTQCYEEALAHERPLEADYQPPRCRSGAPGLRGSKAAQPELAEGRSGGSANQMVYRAPELQGEGSDPLPSLQVRSWGDYTARRPGARQRVRGQRKTLGSRTGGCGPDRKCGGACAGPKAVSLPARERNPDGSGLQVIIQLFFFFSPKAITQNPSDPRDLGAPLPS